MMSPISAADPTLLAHGSIRMVNSFEELVNTPFHHGLNALCWKRELAGDFAEIVQKLRPPTGITTIDETSLMKLQLSEAGQKARAMLLSDQHQLQEHGLDPCLDCILGYSHDDQSQPQQGIIRTDVCSFHVDSATVEADTYLCTYFGPSSEGLLNQHAVLKAEVPEIRARLLEDYGGDDDEGFAEYLAEHFYDLHYLPLPEAQPYAFGVGNLWRIAIQHPMSQVLPCIHRAPDPVPGQPPRLLLIS